MKVCVIWWWTWSFNVLSALKNLDNIEIFSIINMSDDWWSTWKLRDEYWVLPPWDLRRALVALSDDSKSQVLRNLFNFRFEWWILDWHNLWNLLLMALENIYWNYWNVIYQLENIFNLKWKIFPSTYEKTRLLCVLENWDYILWEKNIDIPKHNWKIKIKKLFVIKDKYYKIINEFLEQGNHIQKKFLDEFINLAINDVPQNNQDCSKIILESDYIIIWPWDLYTSILPNFLLWNIKESILKSNAKKVLISNLFTKFWETYWFKLSDFIEIFNDCFWNDIFDYIIAHDFTKFPIDKKIQKNYKLENKEIIICNLNKKKVIKWDLIRQYDYARHDSLKINKYLKSILQN